MKNNMCPIKIGKKRIFYLSLIFLIAACNYNQVSFSKINDYKYLINYDTTIPEIMKSGAELKFNSTNSNGSNKIINLYFKEFKFDRYDIFSGPALRASEVEIRSKVKVTFDYKSKKYNKNFMSMKRFKSNELNPFADKEKLQYLKNQQMNDILDQIHIEVSLIEM